MCDMQKSAICPTPVHSPRCVNHRLTLSHSPVLTPSGMTCSAASTSAATTSGPSSSGPAPGPSSLAPREEPRPAPYVPDRRPREPEVSEEKKKLAASLFGGGPSAASRGAAKGAPRPATKTKLAEGGRAGTPTNAAPAPQPEVNLLDFGSDEPAADPTPAPAADPFQQLEGLSVSTSAPLPVDPLPRCCCGFKASI